MPTHDEILKALEAVIDPELRRSIVELGMVRSIEQRDGDVVDVTVSLTTPGCPIRNHFETAVQTAVDGTRRSLAGERRLRRALRRREGRASAQSRPRVVARGRAGPGRERRLHRLRQGRRRQVHDHRQSRGGARRRGQARRRARRRRLGLLDPAHVRRRRPPAVSRGSQDPPARGARREGHVDRLLRRGGRRRRLARADASQGAHAVPRGRRVGRARLPARRPAARHRRRLDDARAASAAGQVRDRHHAAADRADESRAARPRWHRRSTSRWPRSSRT